MSFLSRVLGAPTPATQQSGADTIAKLCDRVQSSTLLDDRRDAVRALKALSKKFRLDVGTQAMDILTNVLETDRSDAEITGYALDTLFNVLSGQEEEEESGEELTNGDMRDEEQMQLCAQFAEIFIKNPNNIPLVLGLLEDYEFRVRWPAIKLLTTLLSHQASQVQQCVLSSPMGVSKMMDLLSDSREVIRNDGLLLLIQLTKANANIQKIVAFENAFERLLEIMSDEGGSDGGIVVEDCLLLLINLLKKNSSNQSFFKEGGLIQRLTPFFNIQRDDGQGSSWSAQKVNNVHLMLQIVRILVAPGNPQQATGACQKVVNQCGLLKLLCDVLMASGVPADILTETINTVSEVIRGCRTNQEFFAGVNAPSNPPRPAIVVLLMSMVNEKQPFLLRCAVLYCFQCFLYRNELGQEQIIATLLPATADVSAVTAGQLLCGGLFSTDPLSNWCAAVALAHALKDNPTQKEQLLRVQLATGLGNPPVSLLQQCTNLMAQPTVQLQTRLGLLILLSSWVAHSQLAVSHFLGHPGNIPFLTSQVAENAADEQEQLVQGLCAFLLGICTQFNDNSNKNYTKEGLQQLIAKRIGVESFVEKLEAVSKHESYTQAAKKQQLRFDSQDKVLFDYEFTALFKQLEGSVIKAIQEGEDEDAKKTVDDHNSIVTQYKDIIREQDVQLSELRQKHEELSREYNKSESLLNEQSLQIQQLKDQYILLKAQHSGNQSGAGDEAGNPEGQIAGQESADGNSDLQKQVAALAQQLQEKEKELEKTKEALTIADAKAVLGTTTHEHASHEDHANYNSSGSVVADLEAEIARLRVSLEEHTTIAENYRQENEDLTQQLLQQSDDSALIHEKATMASRIVELEARLMRDDVDAAKLKEENKELTAENESLKSQIHKASSKAANPEIAIALQRVQQEKDELSETARRLEGEKEQVQKELDDLLVLLTETDEKKDSYKERLKALNQDVSDNELEGETEEDEDEDEEDDDDEEDDGEA